MDSLLKNVNIGAITGALPGSPGSTAQGTNPGFSIQSLFQSMSLTGNIMIDSFIIMNAFAFVKE